jgi:redox-sensitive bicupin YhaK (pirin superfamily)
MIRLRKAGERGHADHGWLNTWRTFSFADYYDPQQMGFRSLRVINDDVVAGGGGFGTHPHRDMEIITYVLSGALEHKDSMGNGSVIRPGQIQYMAAGTGVQHSEFNHSQTEPVHLLQIWIQPDERGVKPRYAEKSLTDTPERKAYLIASKTGRDGSIAIHQDADVYVARLRPGDQLSQPLREGRGAWLHLAEGALELNGERMTSGDGAAITAETTIEIKSSADSQILLFDLA